MKNIKEISDISRKRCPSSINHNADHMSWGQCLKVTNIFFIVVSIEKRKENEAEPRNKYFTWSKACLCILIILYRVRGIYVIYTRQSLINVCIKLKESRNYKFKRLNDTSRSIKFFFIDIGYRQCRECPANMEIGPNWDDRF